MLGEGSFGKVFLVTIREDKTKTAYALKMMNKKQLLDSKQVRSHIFIAQHLSLLMSTLFNFSS